MLHSDHIDTIHRYVSADITYIKEGDYVVTETAIADRYIVSILGNFLNKTTFGTGFPTLSRKYPLLEVTRDYILLYDGSEI